MHETVGPTLPDAENLPPQPLEVVVNLGIPFFLFPSEILDHAETENSPIEGKTTELFSAVVIYDPIRELHFPFSIHGVHHVETVEQRENLQNDEQDQEDGPDIEINEINQEELERNGMLGIQIQTRPLGQDLLTTNGELRKKILPVVANLRIRLTLGNKRIVDDLIPDINTEELKGFSFLTEDPLRRIEKKDLGKIQGQLISIA